VSFNSHKKAGIQHPADYLRNGLRLIGMEPFRSLPPGFFNTIPYELVFRKENSRSAHIKNVYDGVNAAGELMQLGLDRDIRPLIARFLTCDENVSDIFSMVCKVFYSDSFELKNFWLDELNRKYPSALSNYLYGNYCFARGDLKASKTYLNESIFLGLSDFARVRAKVMLLLIDRLHGASAGSALEHFKRDAGAEAGGLLDEIENIVRDLKVVELTFQVARIMNLKISQLQRLRLRLMIFSNKFLQLVFNRR
jgi:hypothetical protein